VKSLHDKIALFSSASEDVARLTPVSMISMKSASSGDQRQSSIGKHRMMPKVPEGRSQTLMDIQPARRTMSYQGQNAFPTISMEQQPSCKLVTSSPYSTVSSLLSSHAGSSNLKDLHSSISSLASSTSLISQQVSAVRWSY